MKYSLVFLVMLVPSISLAHGGGLDSYGCHNQKATGTYHCHRGSLAGQTFASKNEMIKALSSKK